MKTSGCCLVMCVLPASCVCALWGKETSTSELEWTLTRPTQWWGLQGNRKTNCFYNVSSEREVLTLFDHLTSRTRLIIGPYVLFLNCEISLSDCCHHLTGVFRVHMRRVEAKVDEEGNGYSILEPLHHIGLAVQGVGHSASQDDVISCTGRHKLGLLSHSVGTCRGGQYPHVSQVGYQAAHLTTDQQAKQKKASILNQYSTLKSAIAFQHFTIIYFFIVI